MQGSEAETQCLPWGLENRWLVDVFWDLTGPQLGVNTGQARACILVMYSSWDCELEEEEGWVGTPRVAESSRVSVMVGSRASDRSNRLGFIL